MKEYYEREALNYSTLSMLDSNNPGGAFQETEFKMTDAMIKGSLVDCLLTSPDEFKNSYQIVEEISVTPKVSEVLDKLVEMKMEYTDANILFIAKELGMGGTTWTNDRIISSFNSSNSALKYYNNKKKLQEDKIPITQELYDRAEIVVDVLKNHEFSKWIFEPKEDKEILFQYPIYWKRDDVECKALLDILIIDHYNRIIIPIDLKTKSDSQYNFEKSFIRYKYYLQAAWYTEAVKFIRDEKYPDYYVQNFTFLVTSFDYPDPPITFVLDATTSKAGFNGGVLSNGEKVKGIFQLEKDYLWYKQNGTQYPREINENRGILVIEPFLTSNNR